MNMAAAGWVWEGHGLDPGVHPSVFGVGEGAAFFGLRKAHFLFHPTTDLALQKLRHLDEVRCDISKWRFRDCGERNRGSESFCASDTADICREAEHLSRFSLAYPNVTGAIYDDMRGLMAKRGAGTEDCARIYAALKSPNSAMTLECVVYSHELDDLDFWRPLAPYVDAVGFWIWCHERLADYEHHIDTCRALFPGKPILLGCYLRDYPTQAPLPMEALQRQWRIVAKTLEDGRVAGFEILGTVLIDGQLEQATWVRDFIRDHS